VCQHNCDSLSMLCSHTYQIETNFQMHIVSLECSHGARSHSPSEIPDTCLAADDTRTNKRTHTQIVHNSSKSVNSPSAEGAEMTTFLAPPFK